ncbi:MAG TPA: extracellular solute-binding protein [Gammaproteobacteria bacterium]|nr:extracellular solute-binding protein [Gammaproteobacteria bacterium]
MKNDLSLSRRELLLSTLLSGTAALTMTLPGVSRAASSQAAGTINLADIGVGNPGGNWSKYTAQSNWDVNLIAIGNAPSAVMNKLLAGGGRKTYDLINIVGGMLPPLVNNHLIEPIDTSKIPNWSKDSYISSYLSKGSPGYDFIAYQNTIYSVPTVLQGDAFAYLPEKTGKLSSYGALFDPKWKGYTALEDNYTTAGQKTAMYLKHHNLASINDPANMTPAEIKQVVDFLIKKKKEGQFRTLWSSFQQAVNLMTSKEVYVIDCWEPMVFAAKDKGVDWVYADPEEGYLLWAMAANLVKKPGVSAAERKAAYELLNFMLGGWYGAKITLLRGYMTNPHAVEYAKAHPNEFSAKEAQKIERITKDVKSKFDQGGSWQQRWPKHIDAYQQQWERFKAA